MAQAAVDYYTRNPTEVDGCEFRVQVHEASQACPLVLTSTVLLGRLEPCRLLGSRC
jgi:hypothetical protein